jgi:hypothetical protein
VLDCLNKRDTSDADPNPIFFAAECVPGGQISTVLES